MWFLFGFVTLVAAIGFEFWRRHTLLWTPDDKCGGYDYKFLKSKNGTTGLLLGTECSSGANFLIKKQTFTDSFFKRLGVSREFETGDLAFDATCYLATDCKELHQILVDKPKLRTAIKVILEFSGGGFKAAAIYCRGGRVWIEFDTDIVRSDDGINLIVKKLGHPLSSIVNEITDFAKTGQNWKDPFVHKAIIILAVSSAFVINAAIQFYRTTFNDLPFILYPKEIAIDALVYSFIVLTILILITLYWLKRSARTHLVLVELVTVGAIGLFSSIGLEMRDINIEFDKSKPEFFETKIISMHVSKGKRGTTYSMKVKNWNCECGNLSIGISNSTYNLASISDPVMIAQRNGYLGYTWISAVDVYWHRQ